MKTIWDKSFTRIVLEIPHRGKPLAWFATDENDFRDKLIGGFTGSEVESFSELLHEGVEDGDHLNHVSTDQLLDIAGSDLQKFTVFETIDEARIYALENQGQGFSRVYDLLSEWDLLLVQISYKGNNGLVEYDTFAGGSEISYQVYSAIEDGKKILGVDFVTTSDCVLAEVPDLDIEGWEEECAVDESAV